MRSSVKCSSLTEDSHTFFASFFGKWGEICAKYTLTVFLVGFCVWLGLCFGLLKAEEEKNIDELWVEEGTRLRDEKKYFEERWGGLIRKQLVLTRSKNPLESAADRKHLDAHLAAMIPLFTEDEEMTAGDVDFNTRNNITITPKDQLSVNFTVDGLEKVYTQKDFCETNPVPPPLQPGAGFTLGYVNLSHCMATLYGDEKLKLPLGWGITRLPCLKTTILDCFREGGYDYPLAMKQLEAVAPVLSGIKRDANAIYQTCYNTTRDFYISLGLPAAQYVPLLGMLDSLVDGLAGYGYWWRKSYKQMTDDEIASYLASAWNNKDFTAKQCIGGGLPCCMSGTGRRVSEWLFAGGFARDANGLFTGKLKYIRTVVQNFNENHPKFRQRLNTTSGGKIEEDASGDGWAKDLVEAFEKNMIDMYSPKWKGSLNSGFGPSEEYSDTKLYFQAWRSVDDVIDEGSKPETHLIVVGYVVLLFYASFSLAKLHPFDESSLVYSRVMLGFMGVVVIAFATLVSFGLTSLLGFKLSPININLVPFLSLGIGVDDMFVLAHTLRFASAEHSVETRLQKTMEIAGPSVFLTSLANICAFSIASITPIPAVSLFVVQMALSALVNFLVLMTLFVPIMVWDAQRTDGKRVDFACCIQKDVKGEEEVENVPMLSKFVTQIYGPLMTKPVTKAVVLLAFAAFFAAMLYNGIENTEEGFRISDMALRGSYVRDIVDITETEFGGYDNFIVTGTPGRSPGDSPQRAADGTVTNMMDFSDDKTQEMIMKAYIDLQTKSPWVTKQPPTWNIAWLFNSSTSFLGTFGGGQPLDGGVPQGQVGNSWYSTTTPHFPTWQVGGLGALYSGDLSCLELLSNGVKRKDCETAGGNTIVEGSKTLVFHYGLTEHQHFIDAIEDSRSILDGVVAKYQNPLIKPGSVFVYGYIFQYWEQFLNIQSRTMEILGYSVLGVFLATLLFMFSPLSSFLVAIVIIMVDVELYGLMSLINVKLNAFSVVNLVMTVGMAVEFTAHIAHVFLIAAGTRDERMVRSLEEMFAPVTNGFVSSFLAVIALAFAQFPFFRRYYFSMFALMAGISYVNGVILLPVLLSLFGPRSVTTVAKSPSNVQLSTV